MNDHVRPCNLKPPQRDLTPVLRRPVEPSGQFRTYRSSVDGRPPVVIQGSKMEPETMRYKLNDYEWRVIKPMLPNKPRTEGRFEMSTFSRLIKWFLLIAGGIATQLLVSVGAHTALGAEPPSAPR